MGDHEILGEYFSEDVDGVRSELFAFFGVVVQDVLQQVVALFVEGLLVLLLEDCDNGFD